MEDTEWTIGNRSLRIAKPESNSVRSGDHKAQVVELADTPDLGSGAERREGSSPFLGSGQG